MHFPLRLFLPLFILFSLTSNAENILVKPEPGWLYKVTPVNASSRSPSSASNGYYIEFADQQVNIATQTEYNHFIRNIINETGVQNASEVSINFAPEYQKIIFHKLILLRNGKMINQLNPDQIKVVQEETDAGDFQYNGIRRAFITLKGVQKGDRIDFSYSIIGFNPVFENQYSDKLYFASSNEITNYFQTYIVPDTRKLIFKTYNNAPAPVETKEGNLLIYHWSNPPIKVYETQNSVPVWFDNYPHVSVSEFQSWKDVTDWGIKLFNNYKYSIPEDLKLKIAKWHALAKGDKEMFANLATRFVQDEIRYLGLETGIYTHKPHLPGKVFEQRFGDCKDKALLLTVILQQENIPAFVALVNTTSRSRLTLATPSTNEFDHAIVAIERSSGYLFVDATISYQRGEFSTTYIPDYGYALIIRDGVNNLQPIEPGYPNTTSITEKLELPFTDSGRLTVETIHKGGAADNFRSILASMSRKEMSESFVQYYVTNYDGIRPVQNFETSDDSIRNELILKESYIIPSLWKETKPGKISVDLNAKSVYEKIPDPAGAYSGGPVAISFPLTLNYVLEIKLDEPWEFPFEDLHIKNDSYQFDFTSAVNGNLIELNYHYKTFKDHIPEKEVATYKDEYKKMADIFYFNLSKPGTGVNTNGKHTPGSNTSINWIAVLVFLLTLGGSLLLLRKYNKRSSTNNFSSALGQSLGGWVMFLGITLIIAVPVYTWSLINASYFSGLVWKTFADTGNNYLQIIFMAELVYYVFCIVYVSYLLYWFFNRRDIFPRMFMGYMGGIIGGQMLILVLYTFAQMKGSILQIPKENTVQLVRSIIYGAIWISYLLRSERVKSTFIIPFNSSGKSQDV